MTGATRPGAPPGTLAAPPPETPPVVLAHRWSAGGDHDETELGDLGQLAPPEAGCLWVDVIGSPSATMVETIGARFDLHPLPLEDVLDSRQRPKAEDYGALLFVVLDTLELDEHIKRRRVALFVGERFLITFQEAGDPSLEPVRERMRQGRGRLRQRGPDYLAYAVIDSIVDHYFPVLDRFDESLEQLEEDVLEARSADAIALSRTARQNVQTIRHAIWPAGEVLAELQRGSELIRDETRIYLRDCHDHIVQLVAMVERSREISSNLLEVYISAVSLETNRAMKVLTVIATIFIPLTFITGVYGMNFDPSSSPLNMPELDWYWGYPFALGLMIVTALGLLWFFARRRWF